MRPISSMSLCLPARRTHFWIVAARGGSYGTGSSPRKYGTNCIIPELVNIGAVGCVGIRLAEGTSVCCLAAKNSFQVRRRPVASMGAIEPTGRRDGVRTGFGGCRGQPCSTSAGSSASRSRIASRPSATAARRSVPRPLMASGQVGRDPLGRVAGGRLLDEPHEPERHAEPEAGTDDQPEQATEHARRYFSAGCAGSAGGPPGARRQRQDLDDRVGEGQVGQARSRVDRAADRLGGAEHGSDAAPAPTLALRTVSPRSTRPGPSRCAAAPRPGARPSSVLAIDTSPTARSTTASNAGDGHDQRGQLVGSLLFLGVSACVPCACGSPARSRGRTGRSTGGRATSSGRYCCGDPALGVVVRIVVAHTVPELLGPW